MCCAVLQVLSESGDSLQVGCLTSAMEEVQSALHPTNRRSVRPGMHECPLAAVVTVPPPPAPAQVLQGRCGDAPHHDPVWPEPSGAPARLLCHTAPLQHTSA